MNDSRLTQEQKDKIIAALRQEESPEIIAHLNGLLDVDKAQVHAERGAA